MRRCLFQVLSVGPVPSHILDGNRRYARKWGLTLMKYCYELGVKYITVYAFSTDNFKRKPDEVQGVMDLMLEKIEGLVKEESIVNQYGVRVEFVGNLKLLSEPVRNAAMRVSVIRLSDVDMGVAPDPEILVRTSGETRLSNFLLWLPAVFTQGAVARAEFSEGSEEEASVTLIIFLFLLFLSYELLYLPEALWPSLPPPISFYSLISIFIRIASLQYSSMANVAKIPESTSRLVQTRAVAEDAAVGL
ncbi:hypothetical protein SASPL_135532 [Salvia splendens]|uniref:Alkyl transferase n=1 Tax=Salvia splendens TaxID=180675 RepID=A0A8X8WYC5_SALSN|nr:hypothetical protein SASPL_135532 [Salvia splendens]